MTDRKGSVAIVGAGDYIGSEIAKKFASQGFIVYAGRRNGEKLQPLIDEINAAGGEATGLALDARNEAEVVSFLEQAEAAGPLEAVIFNVGANVKFPLLDTTERVFRKVWEMACYAGFLTGREAARLMLPRGRGALFFTGATAGLRGNVGYAAFSAAKSGLRAVAQSSARELMPQGIHVAHLVIDSGVDTEWVRGRMRELMGDSAADRVLMRPAAVADAYWQLFQQPMDSWTFEMEIRPSVEPW